MASQDTGETLPKSVEKDFDTTPEEVAMPTAPVNGIQLYYEVYGDGPRTKVFAHGAGGNHLSWWQQVPYFCQRYRCITFGHRGFYGSVDAPNGPGSDAFMEDLGALLDHLEARDAVLVGQSMGGLACFGLALKQPARVKALVMADTVIGIPSKPVCEALISAWRRRQPGDPGPIISTPPFSEREPGRAFLQDQVRNLNPENPLGQNGLRRMVESLPDLNLSAFSVPTLFVFGTDDVAIPPELGRLAQTIVPGSRYCEIPKAGHSAHWERPEEFNRILAEFLQQVGY